MTDDPTKVPVDTPPPEAARPIGDEAQASATAPESATCSQCGAARVDGVVFCGDCGFIFATQQASAAAVPEGLFANRYRLTHLVWERGGVARYRGVDEGTLDETVPVVVVRQRAPGGTGYSRPRSCRTYRSVPEFEFDLPEMSADQATIQIANPGGPEWPGLVCGLGTGHPAACRAPAAAALDRFVYGRMAIRIWSKSNLPARRCGDAWDRTDVTNRDRFGWLDQIARTRPLALRWPRSSKACGRK